MMMMMMMNPLAGIFKNGASVLVGGGGGGVRIELFDSKNQAMLQNLQECRRTAFQANKQNWMDSERDFVKAKSVTDGKNLCAVAIDNSNGKIVGSADLTPQKKGKNIVTNVFVTPDQRGKGIGKLLMTKGIEGVLVRALPSANIKNGNSNTNTNTNSNAAVVVIELDVYTNNKAAFQLYQKLGYEPSSSMHSGTLVMAKTLGANFVVSLSKTVKLP
mmetsp:Transcript_13524/g.33994  ORF Transcript_13524/g.33994 Transcript_13524/m.33994 type:complete len:216 (+) Transcript_13524:3-650(+)